MINQQDAGTNRSNRRAIRAGRAALMLSAGVLALVCAQPALAQDLPTGGTVVGGAATIGGSGDVLNVNQSSDRAVINWTSFDIASGHTVNFVQPDAQSVVVNRVSAGGGLSEIYGEMNANGIVAILNPNGVHFGGSAEVNVGGLIATTGDLADQAAFLAGGDLAVSGATGGAVTLDADVVVNLVGNVADLGLAAFVAPHVSNSGTITATGGRILLGGGEAFTLDLAGDGLLEISVPTDSPLVENYGALLAAGGRIQMTASAAAGLVNNVINLGGAPAGGVHMDGDVIVLEAAGNAIQVQNDLNVQGDLSMDAYRVHGAGDIDVAGALTLNIDPQGDDTTGESLIADALGVIGAVADGSTLNLAAGVYAPGATVNVANVTVDGGGVARIASTVHNTNGLNIGAGGDGATVTGLEIVGLADAPWDEYAWGGTVTRGVALQNGAENVTVTDNVITGVRNGILIDGRNAGSVISGNVIDNTKSAISVQYTNASNLVLDSNVDGDFGNEWGIILHLNGVWNGAVVDSGNGELGANTPLIEQQRLLALSAANGHMTAYNQAYTASNRTHVNVSASGSPTGQGAPVSPINSVHGGVAAVVDGGFVSVADGTYNFGSTRLIIDKSLTLTGESESGVILDGRGIAGGLGTVLVAADDVSLSGFTLYGADSGSNNFGIKVQPNPTGYNVDQRVYNFSISDVTLRGATRAELDLNGVVGATITNVTADGRRVGDDSFQSGGAGIQITDSQNITLTGVTTIGNAWGSVAIYQTNAAGAYNGLTDNININASENVFNEALGVFVQSYSDLHPEIGQLNLTGFDYVVRNTGHRANGDQFTFFRTSLSDATAFALALTNASTGSIEGWTGTDYTNAFTVVEGLAIGSALRDARDGGTITVGAGEYVENLLISQSDLTLQSVDGRDSTTIRGVVSGSASTIRVAGGAHNFTLGGTGQGFTIIGNANPATPAQEVSAIYLAGASSDSSIIGNRITANGGAGLTGVSGAALNNLVIDGNIFDGQTFSGTPAGDGFGQQFTLGNVPRQLVVINSGDGVTFSNNQITGTAGGVNALGAEQGNTLITIDASNSAITGNTFAGTTTRYGNQLRARGADVEISGNIFDNAGMSASTTPLYVKNTVFGAAQADFAELIGDNTFTGGGAWADASATGFHSLTMGVQAAVNEAASGATVNVLAGDYEAFAVNKDLTVLGAGVGQTFIRPTASLATGVGHKYDADMNVAVFVTGADDVTLDGMTIDGNGLNNHAAVFWHNASGEIRNTHITNVRPFSGAQSGQGLAVTATTGNTVDLAVTNVQFDDWNKNAIDVVTGAGAATGGGDINLSVTGSTFTGRGDTGVIAQNGVMLWERAGGTITASLDDVTISDIGFTGASVGAGVLVYGSPNAQLTIENSRFNGLERHIALSAGSASGVDATQGNSFDGVLASEASLSQLFDIEDRIDHGVDFAGNGLVSVVDGQLFVTENSGSGAVGRATTLASSGDVVNVAAGEYDGAVAIAKGLTLAGAGMNETTFTGGISLHGTINDLSLRGFTVRGVASGSAVVRGVSSAVDGFAMNDVRVDAESVTGRQGIGGGQFGGEISITESELLNVDHWVVFDTRSGSGAPANGTNVSSFVFSDNLVANVRGGITVRQNDGGLGSVTISRNTVRDIGDSAQSSGGIFKIFNAGSVEFSDNVISDIGTNASLTSDGVAYGAALLVRGVDTLEVTGNSFTNVHMALATEKNGFAAPNQTTFSDNTFTNVGYGLFMPVDALATGSVNFGAGNNFIAGDDTVQHIVWRGGGALDLTNVQFGGQTAAEMSQDARFALEDMIFHGVDVNGAGLATVVDGQLFVTEASGAGAINRAVGLASDGDTVNLSGGDHLVTSTVDIDQSIYLVGAGQDATHIDASGVSGYGLHVTAEEVWLTDFTLTGPSVDAGSSFGIKVNPTGGRDAVLDTFWITNVTAQGSGRAELDLNGVMNATIDGFTADGMGTKGAGIQIADSDNILIQNSVTRDNAWGGVALYSANQAFDQQLANIVITADNDFQEANGLFLQHYSAIHDGPENITVLGYDYAVQNDEYRAADGQWVYFQKTRQDAFDFAVNLGSAEASWVQGWAGDDLSDEFFVGFGELAAGGEQALSIQTAFDQSSTGSGILIETGDYGQTSTLNGVRLVQFNDVSTDAMTFASGAAGSTIGGELTVAGALDMAAVVVGDDTTLRAETATLAGVDGLSANGQTLMVQADSVALGSAGANTALRNLMIFGDATLTGADYAAFGMAVTGATTLAGDVSIAASGPVSLGAVDGAHALAIQAGASAVLGAVGETEALASLAVAADAVTTAGASTTGAQAFTGATVLNGAYASGGDFSVNGASTLGGAVTVASGGDAALGAVDGAQTLSVSAEGDVTLGAVGASQALASLTASGDAIVTAGASTTGDQAFTGATALNGGYATSGGDFTVNGATTLAGAASVTTTGGDALFGAVNGSGAGAQAFTLNAGGGDATLGSMGADVRLGAASVSAGRTVLNGAVYAASSLNFGGGAGATVRLTQVTTTFNTVQSATAAGAITITPHLIGTANGEQGVVFLAGTGLSAGDGDIVITDAGTDAIRLGAMTATGGDFSAETVKLAGDFTSLLSGDQLFSDDTLDTLANVDATVAGNESGPIIAGGSVNIDAGGSATGSIQAGGPVNVTYGSASNRVINAQGPVTVNAAGPVGGSITSGGAVNVTSGGAITSTIDAGGAIVLTSDTPVNVQVNGGVVTVNAPGGVINGVFSQINTDPRGTFIINEEVVVGEGFADARQILVDGFLAPAGGVVGADGLISLPAGLAIALIAPAGEGEGQRPAVVVNSVDRLGELLRLGYTAIIIQIDESGLLIEEELVVAQTEIQAASGAQ